MDLFIISSSNIVYRSLQFSFSCVRCSCPCIENYTSASAVGRKKDFGAHDACVSLCLGW